MIDGKTIAERIARPEQVPASEVKNLRSLIAHYPYCSSLYTLLLKAYKNANHLAFERQLKITAIHAHDRERLFHLVHCEQQDREAVAQTAASVQEHPVETRPSSPQSTPHLQEKSTLSYPKIKKTEPSVPSSPAPSRPISMPPERSEPPLSAKGEPLAISNVSKESASPQRENRGKVPQKSEAADQINQPISFVQWLNRRKSKEKEPSKKRAYSLDSESDSQTKDALSKSEINALLDKFIQEEPSLSPLKKTASSSPSSNAKRSVEESAEIASETLAKIHIMQGNYKKAITTYRQLMIAHPEKKTFFARQIEVLEAKRADAEL